MSVARRALQLHLAFSTCVGCTSERLNMLLCFTLLASVARGATHVFVLDCISFVLELAPWKSIAGELLVADSACDFLLLLVTFAAQR